MALTQFRIHSSNIVPIDYQGNTNPNPNGASIPILDEFGDTKGRISLIPDTIDYQGSTAIIGVKDPVMVHVDSIISDPESAEFLKKSGFNPGMDQQLSPTKFRTILENNRTAERLRTEARANAGSELNIFADETKNQYGDNAVFEMTVLQQEITKDLRKTEPDTPGLTCTLPHMNKNGKPCPALLAFDTSDSRNNMLMSKNKGQIESTLSRLGIRGEMIDLEGTSCFVIKGMEKEPRTHAFGILCGEKSLAKSGQTLMSNKLDSILNSLDHIISGMEGIGETEHDIGDRS